MDSHHAEVGHRMLSDARNPPSRRILLRGIHILLVDYPDCGGDIFMQLRDPGVEAFLDPWLSPA
ncbi:hypothetical protein KB879_07210 [Cupriavidus sp. KK10]|jgi:hypothetical protein|uniref:hypothetical protein n=1 Tax=Cupriavidus TaxID=106589 RepID=UPI0011D228DF|nr:MULTISPECIES: hypothetical protein [Cupriavidus]MDX6014656.1 hypothetical protein [Cupriavidus necator]QUN29709.1 hypothetical protein KB879_07210 [Cupriavidus sp. KK10]